MKVPDREYQKEVRFVGCVILYCSFERVAVYRLEIQSIMLVFSTGFVNYCPSNLLFGQLSHPPPPFPV